MIAKHTAQCLAAIPGTLYEAMLVCIVSAAAHLDGSCLHEGAAQDCVACQQAQDLEHSQQVVLSQRCAPLCLLYPVGHL